MQKDFRRQAYPALRNSTDERASHEWAAPGICHPWPPWSPPVSRNQSFFGVQFGIGERSSSPCAQRSELNERKITGCLRSCAHERMILHSCACCALYQIRRVLSGELRESWRKYKLSGGMVVAWRFVAPYDHDYANRPPGFGARARIQGSLPALPQH